MKKILFATSILVLLILVCNTSYAFDPGQISKPKIDNDIIEKIGGVVRIIQIVGTGIAVGASIYLGIRYMLSSVEEKAEIKKKMIPFVIGAVIFFGATGILRIIAGIAKWF